MPNTTDALPADLSDRFRSFYAARRVCVTGGAGFIGGHLTEALLSLGAEVSILDDLSTGSSALVGEFMDRFPSTVRFVQGSILEPAALAEAADRCAIVFHQAAMVSVPMSVEEPDRCMLVNALGTSRVAQAAHAAGATRIVYAASSSAYGDTPGSPKLETETPRPLSPYAVGKLTGEHVMTAWSNSYDIDAVALRYFNIFGERQPDDSPYSAVIAKFAALLRGGKPVTIFGDGEQTRDFTHVSNAVLANLLAGSVPGKLGGTVVNVGCGRKTSINELFGILAKKLGVEGAKPTYAEPRVGDVPHSLADLTRARETLGYEPVTTLDEGIDRLLNAENEDQQRSVIGRIA